jgi:hypothetical protein
MECAGGDSDRILATTLVGALVDWSTGSRRRLTGAIFVGRCCISTFAGGGLGLLEIVFVFSFVDMFTTSAR